MLNVGQYAVWSFKTNLKLFYLVLNIQDNWVTDVQEWPEKIYIFNENKFLSLTHDVQNSDGIQTHTKLTQPRSLTLSYFGAILEKGFLCHTL